MPPSAEDGQNRDAEVYRLERRRLTALEARLGAELALGRHAETVDELARLVEEHPLREQFRYQLMLAMYRCSRRAEALEVYRDGRARKRRCRDVSWGLRQQFREWCPGSPRDLHLNR